MMKIGFRKGLLATTVWAGGLLVAGCASTPDLGALPQAKTDYATAETLKDAANTNAAWPGDRWWESYNDPELTALVTEALADSPNLAAAAARVRKAQANAQETGAAEWPTLSATGGTEGAYQHLGGTDLPPAIAGAINGGWSLRSNAGLKMDYQLDFFGRNRAAFAAATSRAQAQDAEAAAARLQLSTAVASSYADLARLGAQRATAEQTLRLRKDSADLVHQRVTRGLENEGQANQSDSELTRAESDLATVDGNIARTRNALAALLGKGPDRGLKIALPARQAIAVRGLPATAGVDLVGRRPDLVAARLRAEAAAERIKVARADFYPNVTLSAMAGIQTLGITTVGGGTLTQAQVGPAVNLPIFSAGRLEGAYRGARADYDEAVALYDQTMATALKEVADALADRTSLNAQLMLSRNALALAEESYRLARVRYGSGLNSYIDILTIENALIGQRQVVADLEARAFAVDVALVRALGGGFTV